MASRGDHQGPWVRHVSALLLLGHGTCTSGSITKNKDLGKKAARKHGAKPLGKGWKEPKRAEADRAGHVQGGKAAPPAPHQHPTDGLWRVNRGRQRNGRMCCQHPPKPAGKSLCARQGPPTLTRLLSPRDGQKGWSSRSEERAKGTQPCPGHLPLHAPGVLKGLSSHVIH